jgi:hypothetical protein
LTGINKEGMFAFLGNFGLPVQFSLLHLIIFSQRPFYGLLIAGGNNVAPFKKWVRYPTSMIRKPMEI